MKCLEQYVRSAIYFKNRFCIHKYDAKAKKEQNFVGLLDSLLLTYVILQIQVFIYVSSLLRKLI